MIRVLVLTLLFSVAVTTQERVDLSKPITKPSVISYEVVELHLVWKPEARITIILLGSDGSTLPHTIGPEQAETLIRALNKANLTTNSLHKRVMTQLISDGVITGSVVGTPQ